MLDPTPAPEAAASPHYAPAHVAAPAESCVLRVRGGLAAPARALELVRTHRIRAVGGTQGGVVAAVLLAAAEHGRERGGFGKLEHTNAWLADVAHVAPLFPPEPATRPLLAFLLALERRGRAPVPGPGPAGLVARGWALLPQWARVLFDVIPGAARDALPLRYWTGTVLGGIVGGALDAVLARGLVDASHPLARTIVAIALPVMFVGCYVASLGACAARLWRIATIETPRNGHGLSLGAGAAAGQPPAFTDWLHERIQDLAGLPAGAMPLTLGALAGERGGGPGIALRLVATGTPPPRCVVLPEALDDLEFDEDAWRRRFPAAVVDHLVARARPVTNPRERVSGRHRLPALADLPVVVVARLASDFPMLLGAVPLHGAAADGTHPTWFGGRAIPAHDVSALAGAWLPTRPAGPDAAADALLHASLAWIAVSDQLPCFELDSPVA